MTSLPANRSFRRLRAANRFNLTVVVIALVAAGSPLGLAVLLIIPVSALVVCGFMFVAAREEFGRGYAVRHVVLALLTAPLLLLGPLLVPWMVESDILKSVSAASRYDPESANA